MNGWHSGAIVAALAVALLASKTSAPNVQARSAAAALPGAPRCPIFPPSNVWNRDISSLPVARNSTQMIRAIGLDSGLHPDFGSNPDYGIPVTVVSGRRRAVSVSFDYADESDKGPYP